MLYDVLLIGNIVLFVAVLVLLFLAHRWEEQADQFERWASIAGLIASIGTLVTNISFVTDPDIFEKSWSWGLLLLLSVSIPLTTLTGSILTYFERRGGVPILTVGAVLWLIICIFGVVVSAFGGLA